MRRTAFALAIALSLGPAATARGELLIIDVGPKPEKVPARSRQARLPEVRLVMSESETARKAAPATLAKLAELGYEVAPEAEFGSLLEAKAAYVLLNVVIVRSGESCFVSAKGVELKAETSFWRWETGDDLRPCEQQIQEAVESFVKARPPAKPKAPAVPAEPAAGEPAAAAADPVAAPAGGPMVIPALHLGTAPAGGEAADPAPAPAAGEAAAVQEAGSPVSGGQAEPAAAGEGEGEGGGEEDEEEPEEKKCGCGAGGAASPAALLLALGALLRRRAARG